MDSKGYVGAVGRRKEAVARVRVLQGEGKIIVNGRPIYEYFRGPVYQKAYQKPFELTSTLGKLTATIKLEGGGTMSQLGAVVHGLSRAISLMDKDKYRPILKKAGLLTRDPRVRERRKFGLAGKARAKPQSPKR